MLGIIIEIIGIILTILIAVLPFIYNRRKKPCNLGTFIISKVKGERETPLPPVFFIRPSLFLQRIQYTLFGGFFGFKAFLKAILIIIKGFLIVRQRFLIVRQEFLTVRQRFLIVWQRFLIGRQEFLIVRQKFLMVRQEFLIVRQRFLIVRQEFLIVRQEFLIVR